VARPAARGGAATVRAIGSVQKQLRASARRCSARGGEKWRRDAYRALAGGGSGPVIGRRHASGGGKGWWSARVSPGEDGMHLGAAQR
jgi:hypothetical protein